MILVKNQFSCFDAYTSDFRFTDFDSTFSRRISFISRLPTYVHRNRIFLSLLSFANPQMHTHTHAPNSINFLAEPRESLKKTQHMFFRFHFVMYFRVILTTPRLWKTIRRIWRRKNSNFFLSPVQCDFSDIAWIFVWHFPFLCCCCRRESGKVGNSISFSVSSASMRFRLSLLPTTPSTRYWTHSTKVLCQISIFFF